MARDDFQQVGAGATKRALSPNSMCDWTGVNGNPLQYMPEAMQPDEGWYEKFDKTQGMFGTKNQPRDWLNVIWCATGGTFEAMYTDEAKPPVGLPYRGYQVSNDYQAYASHPISLRDES